MWTCLRPILIGLLALSGPALGLGAEIAAPGPQAATDAAPAPERLASLAPGEIAAPRPRPEAEASPFAATCRMIETAAHDAALDPHFFARLIWRESLFDPTAVSPKGAQGIAQFIPDTAALRGLDDPFDPEKALAASARYLADLTRDFGNLGLAAAAYNGGEARLARYVAHDGDLPDETRAYVAAITGFSAEDWRDAPPARIDLALKGNGFQEGCVALASRRRGAEPAPVLKPWGAIIASNRARDEAGRQVERLRNRYPAVLAGQSVDYSRAKRLGQWRGVYMAQIGRESRDEAEALCGRLRAVGGDCLVLRN